MKVTVAILLLLLFAQSAYAETAVRLTESRGTVYKRGFVDWTREVWSEPEPANQGDILHEGMQIGTGEKSWAQVTWPKVTTRAWANSVYAIAPGQRLVYLLGGEMLYQLDKKRKKKDEYYVWTKLIQARMRGTTVLFQSEGPTTRVTVLEGCADILNRLDKSVIRIKPGVVVQVTDKSGVSSAPGSNVRTTEITSGPAIQVFDTPSSSTSVFKADTTGLLKHALVGDFAMPLPSLSLVQDALGGAGLPSQVAPMNLSSVTEIVAVPKSVTYSLGPQIGTAIPLPPSLIAEFPPLALPASTSAPGISSSTGLPELNKAGANVLTGISGAGNITSGAGSLTTTTGGINQSLPSAGGISNAASSLLNGGAVTGVLNSLSR